MAINATTATRMASPPCDEYRRRERRQRSELLSPGVEVARIEPLPERAIDPRPLPVDHRVPRRVAVAPLVDASLAEDAFVGEAEALRRRARRGIERIALPLVPSVAELERALHHQIHRFGGGDRAL